MEFDDFGNPIAPSTPIEDTPADESSALIKVKEEEHKNALKQLELQTFKPEDKAGFEHGGRLVAKKIDAQAAQFFYGDDVDVVINEEVDQDIAESVVKRIELAVTSVWPSPPSFDTKFREFLRKSPQFCRNLVLLGDTGSGKTTFCDFLMENSPCFSDILSQSTNGRYKNRYMDFSPLEQARGMTFFSSSVSLVSQTSLGKSYLLTLSDTPGHADFKHEMKTTLQLADNAILFVDVTRGITQTTKAQILELCGLEWEPLVVFNKLDELMLNPSYDLKSISQLLIYLANSISEEFELNSWIAPSPNKYLFMSAKHQWCFSLDSISSLYDTPGLGLAIWNQSQEQRGNKTTALVDYVLEPIVKLYYATFKIMEKKNLPVPQLIKDLKRQAKHKAGVGKLASVFLNGASSFTDLAIALSPFEKSQTFCPKVVCIENEVYYLLRPVTDIAVGGYLYGRTDGDNKVHKLKIRSLRIPMGWFSYPVQNALANSCVLIGPVNNEVQLTSLSSQDQDLGALLPTEPCEAYSTLIIAPLFSKDDGKLQQGLKLALQSIPGLYVTKDKTNGYKLFGIGELFLDVVLHLLRNYYARVEIRLSEPSVCLRETCVERTYMALPAYFPHSESKIIIICEPLSEELKDAVQMLERYPFQAEQILKTKFGWDKLAISSIWSSGSPGCYNLLMDDTVGAEKVNIQQYKQEIIAGFLDAIKQGPLCQEPVQSVLFKVIGFEKSEPEIAPIFIAPTVKRACHASMLVSGPRFMEPWYRVDVIGPANSEKITRSRVQRRRGHVVSDNALPGTFFSSVVAEVPVADSFGLSVELRLASSSPMVVSTNFISWKLLPGDPLSPNTKPAQDVAVGEELAADFLTKFRNAKQLGPGPVLAHLLDPQVAELLQ